MNPEQTLVVAVVALYLAECVVRVRCGSVVLRPGLTGRYEVAHPSQLPGNGGGAGLVVLNPLPPLRPAFVCHQWPLTLTSDVACAYVAQSVNFRYRPPQDGWLVALDDVRDLRAASGTILLDGQPFVDLRDDARARRFAAALGSLAAAPREQREDVVDRALTAATDVGAVRRELARYRRHTSLLRPLCHALFLLLLVGLPLSVALGRFLQCVPWLSALAVPCWLGILWAFGRAHRALFPDRAAERWGALIVMALSPAAAIRAGDRLARDLLSAHDPLGVAAGLCDRAAFGAFARTVLLDLHHPMPPVCPEGSGRELREAELAFRGRLRTRLEDLVRHVGLDPDALVSPATPDDATHLSYCPRCHTQYVVASGRCLDCGGIVLQQFSPSPSTTDRVPSPQAVPSGEFT